MKNIVDKEMVFKKSMKHDFFLSLLLLFGVGYNASFIECEQYTAHCWKDSSLERYLAPF